MGTWRDVPKLSLVETLEQDNRNLREELNRVTGERDDFRSKYQIADRKAKDSQARVTAGNEAVARVRGLESLIDSYRALAGRLEGTLSGYEALIPEVPRGWRAWVVKRFFRVVGCGRRVER